MAEPAHPDEILASILIGLESKPNFDVDEELARHPELEAELRHSLNQLRAAGMLPHVSGGANFQRDLVALGIDETVRLRPLQDAPAPGGKDELVVPRVFGGRYRLQRVVGRGGMGAVYAAEDVDFGREVALKLLLFRAESTPHARLRLARLLREARITGLLEHPGIVPVYGIGLTSDRHLYYTMKLVRGHSLRELVRAHEQRELGAEGQFTIQRRVEIVLRVCDALAFAHARGVVHRDLTPNNVMVGRFGEVLVMDWGIAKLLDRDAELVVADESAGSGDPHGTTPGAFLGTPNFASPEQATGDLSAIDERTDVFGIGAILYYLLTGQPPYIGRDRVEVEDRARRADRGIVRSSASFPRPPRELFALCRKAMAMDRHDRYASVDTLAQDLRAFLGHQHGSAWSETPWSWMKKFVRRHAAITTAGIGVALLGALTFVSSRLLELQTRNRLAELPAAIRKIDEMEAPRRYSRLLSPQGAITVVPNPDEHELYQVERISSNSAEQLLDLLLSWGVRLDDENAAHGVVAALGAVPSEARSTLLLAFYRLVERLFMNDVVPAQHLQAHPEIEHSRRRDYMSLAALRPRLVRAARNVVPVMQALGDQRAGLATHAAMLEWSLNRVDSADEMLKLAPTASLPEREYTTFALSQIRNSEETLRLLDDTVRKFPDAYWVRARYAQTCIERASQAVDASERSTALLLAVAHGEAALALWPDSPGAPLNLAIAYKDLGQAERAIAVLRGVLARNENTSGAWINLGVIYTEQKRWTEAIDAMRRATEVAPSDPWTFKSLGFAAMRCFEDVDSQSDECANVAIESFRTVTQLDTNDWEAHYYLGVALQAMAEFEESVAAADAGLRLYPKGQDLRNLKAESLINLGRIEEALALMLDVLADWPDSEFVRGNFAEWLGDLDDEGQRSALQARFDELSARK